VADLRPLHATSDAHVFDITSGSPIQLEVTVRFKVDVERAFIGIVVWNTARDLCVYGAGSDVVGVPPIRARRGETRQFSFRFDANLTRGLYTVEVNVFDVERHRFLAKAKGIRHFQVVEQVTYDGVANLYLVGRETTPDTDSRCEERSISPVA
jgi:hypothetical protein